MSARVRFHAEAKYLLFGHDTTVYNIKCTHFNKLLLKSITKATIRLPTNSQAEIYRLILLPNSTYRGYCESEIIYPEYTARILHQVTFTTCSYSDVLGPT